MIKSDVLNLMGVYTITIMKSWMQYKIDAILRSFAVFMREATGIMVIYLTLLKFDQLNGWNIHEMLFLFSFLFLTYGILILFFTGLRDFGETVRSGQLDRFILRPRGILFQLIFSDADWFAALGHGSLGLTLFVMSVNKVGIDWDFGMVLYCLVSILGGVLIQGGIFLFIATFNIYLLETNSLKELLYWNTRKFAGYPISIFHKAIQVCMVYIVPFAFINYFPAQYFLRKSDMVLYPEYYLYLTPFVGLFMFFMAYGFWRYSLRHYTSSGN